MKRVFVTGYGIISSIGIGAEENYQSLLSRTCGFGNIQVLETAHRSDLPACEIKLTDQQLCAAAGVPENEGYTRTALLGVIAVKEAIHAAALSPEDVGRCGFISATTTGGIREMEKYYYELQDQEQDGAF